MKLISIVKSIFILPFSIACNMSAANHNDVAATNDSTKNGFAVLELFTSEGCSSCPPADAVLAKLSEEYKGNVYALGFHVDYWNRLGWTDSFSNADYSRRQEKYATQLHLNSIYTPQLIINGKTEIIGSNERKVRDAVTKELKKSTVTLIQSQAKQNGSVIAVSYAIDKSSNDILNIALVQSNASTNVKNGENNGHILHHINVVRDFKTLELKNSLNGTINLNIPEHLVAKDCKVIIYLQNKQSMEINVVAETTIE